MSEISLYHVGGGGVSLLTHLPHAPHDAELLCVDEALQHDSDGHVDIILTHIVPQVHLCMCLCHADHGLNVTNCDGNAARGLLTGPKKKKKEKEWISSIPKLHFKAAVALGIGIQQWITIKVLRFFNNKTHIHLVWFHFLTLIRVTGLTVQTGKSRHSSTRPHPPTLPGGDTNMFPGQLRDILCPACP